MNILFFICLLFSLQILYWIVGRRTSRNTKGKEDYFLAGKAVSFFPLMMTFLATIVGGGVMLGAAEEAYRFGWPVLLYPLGAVLGLILLGTSIGRKLASFKVSTVSEILEVVYKSSKLRKITSILSMISLFMILVAQIIASSKFLVSLGVDSRLLFVAFWAIVIIYTSRGGLKAVISTDLMQAAFFSIVFLATFFFVLYTCPSTSAIQVPHLESFTSISSKLCGWLFMPLLFMVIEQDIAQRCFAGASPKVVSKAAFWAGIAALVICIIPVFFGSLAGATSLEVPQGGSVLMTIIAKTTNPWIASVVGCAVLAAIISTATSLINSISSNITGDFTLSFLKRFNVTRSAQWITCAISIAAMFFAFYFDNIVSTLIQSFELSVSCMFVPVFIALFKRHGHAFSAFSSLIFGAMGFVLFRIYPIAFPKEIASIGLSLFGFYGAELIMRIKVGRLVALERE